MTQRFQAAVQPGTFLAPLRTACPLAMGGHRDKGRGSKVVLIPDGVTGFFNHDDICTIYLYIAKSAQELFNVREQGFFTHELDLLFF